MFFDLDKLQISPSKFSINTNFHPLSFNKYKFYRQTAFNLPTIIKARVFKIIIVAGYVKYIVETLIQKGINKKDFQELLEAIYVSYFPKY